MVRTFPFILSLSEQYPNGNVLLHYTYYRETPPLIHFSTYLHSPPSAGSHSCVRNLIGPRNSLTDTAWSPDGRWLAISSIDGSIRTWDVVSGVCCDWMVSEWVLRGGGGGGEHF